MIGVVLILTFSIGYKLIMRTSIRDPKTADLVTGRRKISESDLHQLDSYYAQPRWRRFMSYVKLWWDVRCFRSLLLIRYHGGRRKGHDSDKDCTVVVILGLCQHVSAYLSIIILWILLISLMYVLVSICCYYKTITYEWLVVTAMPRYWADARGRPLSTWLWNLSL